MEHNSSAGEMPVKSSERHETPRSRYSLVLLGVAVFILHFLLTAGHLMSPDEELLYRMSESIAFRGTTAVMPIEADLQTGQLPDGFPIELTFATRPGKEPGEFYAQYLPLQPLLAVPIVWFATLIEGSLAAPFANVMWPGMTVDYLRDLPAEARANGLFRRGVVVMLFNPLIAALSAIVLARLGMLLTGSRLAGIIAAILFAFGTMIWPHSRTFFTEPLAGLFVLLAFEQLIRWNGKNIGQGGMHAILIGLFLGLANWTRVDSPFFTVGIISAMVGIAIWKELQEDSWAVEQRKVPISDVLVAGGIALGAWLALQSFNAWRFAEADITAGYGHQVEGVKFATPLHIGLHGFLASPGKGMFFFSPVLVLGLWGWLRAPRRLAWIALFAYVPFFIAMCLWQNWDGGWCWGPRHVVQVHLPIMLGAVFLFAGAVSLWRKTLAGILLAAGIAVQIYGSSQSPLEFYRLLFLTYEDGTYFKVNNRGMQEQAIARDFTLRLREDDGTESRTPVSPNQFPAPMVDSLYIPQHTQWYGYRLMWQLGHSDLLFHNLIRTGRNPEPRRGEL